LLGVKFIYEVSETVEEKHLEFDEIDFSLITLPEGFYIELKKSTDICSVTEIERLLAELKLMGGDFNILVNRFEHLLNTYDMEGIIEVLDQVNHD
jgi:hypothetical protein